MRTLLHDLRFAGRQLRRNPGFTAVSVATLTLGIGATTALFSLIKGIVLDPPDYHEPHRLARLWFSGPATTHGHLNPADLVDLRVAASVDRLAYGTRGTLTLTGRASPRTLDVGFVSANYFRALGVALGNGRGFSDEEELRGNDRVVVLSRRLFRDVFGDDGALLGGTITLDGEAHTILGIAPAGFEDPITGTDPDVWRPYVVDPDNRGGHFMKALIRLAPGMTLPRAEAELNSIQAEIALAYPFKEGRTITVEPLQRTMVGDAGQPLLILFGAVLLVLLIACANLAGLNLARATDRQGEIAVRAALGAARSRIVGQLVTENMLIGVLGGTGGVLLAVWLVSGMATWMPADVPRLAQVDIDGPVLGFALLVSLLTGLLTGLVPALRSAGRDPGSGMRGVGRRTTGPRSGLRSILVTGQVAVSLVLVIGSGLLLRTLANLEAVDPGFRSDNLLTFRVDAPRARYPQSTDVDALFASLFERVAAHPQVQNAGAVQMLPLQDSWSCNSFALRDRPGEDIECAEERIIRGDYLNAMRIPLLRGRSFAESDRVGALPVVLINQSMAESFWPEQDPVGRQFKWGGSDSGDPWRTVVGVIGNVRHFGLAEDPRAEVYMPHAQMLSRRLVFTVRTVADPRDLVGLVRSDLSTIDPEIALVNVATMDAVVGARKAPARFNAALLGAFAALAAALACIGLYGLLAFTVSRRTREIGIRLTLGARGQDVLRAVVGRGVRLVLLGVVIGVGGSLALTHLLAGLLFGVSPTEPAVFAAAVAGLCVVGLAAAYVPGRRATKIEPSVALRHD
jgi:putative ABC transport system permease protein